MASRIQQIVDLIAEEMNDPDVTISVGRKSIAENNAPPRVVFVPLAVPIVPVKDPGGQKDADGNRQRPIYYAAQTLEVQCWGHGQTEAEQIETTEQLFHNTVAAIRAITYGSVLFAGGEWESQAEGEAGHVMAGEVIVFTVAVEIPIISEIKRLTTIVPPVKLTAKLNDEVDHAN